MKKKIILTTKKQKKKENPNKTIKIGILVICIIINITLIPTIIIPAYSKKVIEKEYQELIKRATVIVKITEDRTITFGKKVKVSDFITEINGKIIDDYEIDTTTLGNKKVAFKYQNDENITIPYSYDITIVDDVAPVVWLNSTKSVEVGYKGNLLNDIVCADNLDDNPKCEIVGQYDFNKAGNYNLVFNAEDESGNKTSKEFTLSVYTPSNNSNTSSNKATTRTKFSDVISTYKNENTKIGIDVSSWQGDINFEAVKQAGVEFVFIRVGSKFGIEGDYFVDKKFKQNIEGFNKVGIPVGIYFYSYANSKEAAINDANWVLNQIKDYKIDYPVVYDWESWSFYNEFNQSFYSLSQSAKAYLDTISEAGYEGVLYSSKNYLENVWFDIGYDVWLAHYTKQTTYEGEYKYWQLCSNGQVDGIYGNVDINIMYN